MVPGKTRQTPSPPGSAKQIPAGNTNGWLPTQRIVLRYKQQREIQREIHNCIQVQVKKIVKREYRYIYVY